MSDKTLAQLPLAINASGALLYGVQGGTDVAISAELLQQQMPAQGANLVYAGPSGPPGALPSFRRLVVNDIPDLSGLYLASTGGNLVGTTINNSTIIGGSISGATAVFDDNKFTIRDEADTTKQAKWEASGISAGTVRSYILPNENGTLTLNTADQALTNKSVFLKASGTSGATFRLPHGVPPLVPVNGDIWTTAGGMYARIDGTTIGPFASAQSGYVTSFNTRVGDITLNQSDVTTALGFTPYNPGANSYVLKTGDTMTGPLTGTVFNDGSGSLRAGITAAANAATSAQSTADGKVSKTGDTITGNLLVTGNTKTATLTMHSAGVGIAVNYQDSTQSVTRFYGSWDNDNWAINSFTDAQTYGGTPLRLSRLSNNLNCDGIITAGGGFGPGSDPRLKDESSLKNVDNALEKVYNLNVKCGKYHDWYNPDGRERVFLMADKAMQESTPEVFQKDVIERGEDKYNGWSADQMIALLTKAVQELTDQVAELRSNLEESKNV